MTDAAMKAKLSEMLSQQSDKTKEKRAARGSTVTSSTY
jgi:hypothetical protein